MPLMLLARHHNSFRFLPPTNKNKRNRFPYHRLHNNNEAQKTRLSSQSEQITAQQKKTEICSSFIELEN